MMRYLFSALLALYIVSSGTVFGAAVECRLATFQYDSDSKADVLIYEDTSVFVKGVPASGMVGPFSLEIEFERIDSSGVAFKTHIVTLGSPPATLSRSFVMEYQLPARLSGIQGKMGARYTLLIIPISPVEVEAGCSFSHRDAESFSSAPSAFMDIHFVPSSLADYHWISIRDYLDFEYRRFQVFAGLTLPGKMQVFACPCPVYSVIWDKRFGMAVDPTRNCAYAMYRKDINSVHPFLVTYTSLLRNQGYSPPFISEGLASYFAFVLHDMKRELKENPELSLKPLLNTHQYLSSDPLLADRISASFVKYLVDRFGLASLMKLYRIADDLNLYARIEETYGKSIGRLETEWKLWVDTVTIGADEYSRAAGLAEQMLNYQPMLEYSRSFLRTATTPQDSLRALRVLKRACFFTGDYYEATSVQEAMLKIDSADATGWMARGSYRMMNGYYDEALADLLKAQSLDPSNQMIAFNLAMNHIYRGQETAAAEILRENITGGKGALAQSEIRILLAEILEKSNDSSDREKAREYYQTAADISQQTLSIRRSSATDYLWLAMALLGLDETEGATEYLQVAEFLETRPFYTGMINLWLGKAYAQSGKKQQARDHLAKVLAVAAADYHQREAQKYLEQL
jgi:tetratricopeptide (TPR) repeat protein